jgi:hypothetical protein
MIWAGQGTRRMSGPSLLMSRGRVLRAGQGCLLITRLVVPRHRQAEIVDAVAAATAAGDHIVACLVPYCGVCVKCLSGRVLDIADDKLDKARSFDATHVINSRSTTLTLPRSVGLAEHRDDVVDLGSGRRGDRGSPAVGLVEHEAVQSGVHISAP